MGVMEVKEQAGEQIEGSRYYRAFCVNCREPMRVSDTRGWGSCERCDGRPLPPRFYALTYRQSLALIGMGVLDGDDWADEKNLGRVRSRTRDLGF